MDVVYLVYVDESGNVGRTGGTRTYTLACVFLEATAWAGVFDDLIGFRRFLKQRFGVPVRSEIKANYLLYNHGPFRRLAAGLSRERVRQLYAGR